MKRKNILKKISVLSIVACLMLSMLPVSFLADNEQKGVRAGVIDPATIPEGAVSISNTYDLVEFAENCVDEEYSQGKVFVLENDIQMSGVEFEGIPTFGGIFLGQGHVIYGLDWSQDCDNIGFFRYIQKNALVKGLKIEANIQPDSGNSVIGGFAGCNKGYIQDCTFVGVVSGKNTVGGFVGINKVSGTIENCEIQGVVHGESMVGGIAGKNQGVIRNCLNLAEVNTAVEHNTIGLDLNNLDMDFELNLNKGTSSFGFSESMDSACDIGGIAGTSSGVIRSCVNIGNVGYEKMGYNIGGIVGSQNGYLVDCINFATINGADGVGGIVGQFRPNVVINFDSSSLDAMDNSMNDMKSSMEDLKNKMDSEDLSISDEEYEDMKDAIDELEKIENIENEEDFENWVEDSELFEDYKDREDIDDIRDLEDLENWEDLEDFDGFENFEDLEDLEDFDRDDFDAALNDFSDSVGDAVDREDSDDKEESEEKDEPLSSELKDMMSTMEEVQDSATNMMNSMENVMSSMENMMNAVSNMSMEIEDVSRFDKPSDTVAKAYNCINCGEIYGSKYVGGIAGNANIENTVDMDDDVVINGEMGVTEGTQRIVIRECSNLGKISVTKRYAGGIVGYMKVGAVFDSGNTGNIDGINANYVGGIAGGCDTVIFNSVSKNIISGSDYVGGIAGWGYEVYDSSAFVDIVASTKYVGSILGGTEILPTDAEKSVIRNNTYFVPNKNIGGIDGINYKGASKRISLDDFLTRANLKDMFKQVNIRFKVEGADDVILTINVGETLSLDKLPVPEVGEGEIYEWVYQKPVVAKILGMNEVEEVLYLSEARLSNVLFDQTYEADFEPQHMVAQGQEKTEDGKTKILAIGAFDATTDIVLTKILSEEPIVAGVKVIENWSVALSNIGVQELRYHIPKELNPEKITIFVKDAKGTWNEREFTVIGSYLSFDFEDGETAFAIAPNNGNSMLVIALVVFAVLAVGITAGKIASKKGKEKKTEQA